MTATTTAEHIENIGSSRIGLGFFEFVITIALMTASVAMAIDSMLPALPAHRPFAGRCQHQRRAAGHRRLLPRLRRSQIIFGSLSDTFGRRNILLGGLAFFTVTMFGAAATESFEMLLLLRFVQGIGAAAVRITTMAMVRDCFGGREMARVMSYVMIVFMIVPIVAPSLGQAVISSMRTGTGSSSCSAASAPSCSSGPACA